MKTKFVLDFGSVKNVGTAAVETIVQEREKNGEFKSFTDFAERIQGETVNKKCIESLIRAGAFDELGETRHTLMNSFEIILDTIANQNKKSIEGQISMFDMPSGEESLEKHKYVINKVQEYEERELLDMEKEMLGIYISGHPLEKLQEKIKANTNINTLQMINMKEENDLSKDGKNVKYAGIITSIKKKYTKNNKIMAFITIEDLYGTAEIIAFENAVINAGKSLIEENIVVVDGRLSIRDDQEPTIIANEIKDLGEEKPNVITFDITNYTEEQKEKLRCAIKYFSGDRNNMNVQVKIGEDIKPCGAIYYNDEVKKIFDRI